MVDVPRGNEAQVTPDELGPVDTPTPGVYGPDEVAPVNGRFRGTVTIVPHKGPPRGTDKPIDVTEVAPAPAATAPKGETPEEPPRTPMESVNRGVNMAGTGIINSALETLGIPGAVGQATEQERRSQKREDSPVGGGDVGAAMAVSYLFNHLIGQHLPSGEQMKETLWPYLEKMGAPRVEPQTGGEKAATEGIKALTPTLGGKATLGAKALAGLSGTMGELASNLSEEHPNVARFLGSIATLIGGGGGAAGVRRTGNMVRDVFAARSPAGQEQLAARGILGASGETDPGALAARIRAGNTQVVPGSQPTTAQAADSANLTAATEAAKIGNPGFTGDVAARETAQNVARRAALGTIEPGGQPEDVRNHLQLIQDNARAHIDNLEQKAAQDVQDAYAKVGPGMDAQRTGQVIRGVAEDAMDEAKQHVSQAYANILGPGRKSQVSIDPGAAVRRIDYMMRNRFGEKNPAPKQLTDLVDAVRNEGQGLSYKDMNDLVVRSGDLAGKLRDSRNAQAAALKIRDILLERMDASASDTAKVLPYTASPEVEARTIRERLTRLNELRDINQQTPLKAWKASRPDLEKTITDLEKKVKADFGISGDLTPQEWARYQHAREMRAEVTRRYEQGPVGQVLERGSAVGGGALSDSQVPGAFFHSRTSAPDDIRQFEEVMGGRPNAVASLREYALGHLNAVVEKNGGQVTPQLLNKWMTDHAAALKPFPELRAELGKLKDATDLAAKVGEGPRATLEDYQRSAARHFLSPDPQRPVDPEVAINNALKPTNRFGRTDMSQLARLAATDASGDATAGLRRGVVDHIARIASGTSVDQAGTPLLMNQKFNKWLRDNRDKVAPVLTPDHLATLDKVAQDLQRGNVGQGAAGGAHLSVAQAMQAALGGYHELLPGVPLVGKKIFNFLFGKSQAEIKDAYNRMLLDPEAAAAGLEKVAGPRAPRAMERLFGRGGSAVAGAAPAVAARTMAHGAQSDEAGNVQQQ